MNDNWQSDTASANPSQVPDPQSMPEFAQAIKSWAEAMSSGDAEASQQAALTAFSLASEEALKNPTPDLLLRQEADALEGQGRWAEAEAVRQKVLALAEATGQAGLVTKAQLDLCGLLRLVGRNQDATHWAKAAINSARQTELFPLVVMALGCEILCALDRGDSSGALAAATESLNAIEPGKLYDQMRARALTTRARCLLASGDPAGATADLTASWELLQAQSGAWMLAMPGPLGARANWWEAKSQLEERQGDLASARAALSEAIHYRRQAEGPYARLALARALEKFEELSRAAGDVAGGKPAREEAEAMRRELRLPGGP